MADLSVVMDKLHGFETADDLAEFFRGYGIMGIPNNSRSCAITQFIKAETGLVNVATHYSRVVLIDSDLSQDEYVTVAENTAAMTQFVTYYDDGYYPDLVDYR